MKVRVYLKVGKDGRGYKVQALTKPKYSAMEKGDKWSKRALPTVLITLDLDIPDTEFEATRILLESEIKKTTPCVQVKQVDDGRKKEKEGEV